MARLTIAAAIPFPVLIITGAHSVAARLDAATRSQCATQDWPAHQHAAHTEFCRVYMASR